MKVAIVFGGSGYIGQNFVRLALGNDVFDKIIVFDLKPLVGFEKEEENNKIEYVVGDVREEIKFLLKDFNLEESWILNLAAIHREPGHSYKEYFDTNIPGANNINQFAERTGIKNILFTSSIAPYGKSIEQRTENSPLYPETAYGISKALAENIHKQWLLKDKGRRLIIVRPSVIFGPKDPGNVYRMIKSIKKGTFILPDGGDVIKGYGYVYGLIESMFFTMNKKDDLIIYNYAENPIVPLKDMVDIVKDEFNYRKPVIKLPINVLVIIAFFIQMFFKVIGKTSDIHPVRVKKAGFPTNIKPQYLIDHGFDFKYDFEEALKHWKFVEPNDFK
jgi:nucleoside-diphosphate-sugar epimerase